MKVLLCGYRDWAHRVCDRVNRSFSTVVFYRASSHEQLLALNASEKFDAIITIGWSWKVPADIVNSTIVVGMHPSDLPDYAGGSPIQNQILDGIEKTNATLFRLNENFDEGEIIDKEEIDLRGHLETVLQSIEEASVTMIYRFIEDFPNNRYTKQPAGGKKVKRLKPEDSRLEAPGSLYDIKGQWSAKELWDFIRCREDPYPNAYFEDHTGKLIIKRVEFEPK